MKNIFKTALLSVLFVGIFAAYVVYTKVSGSNPSLPVLSPEGQTNQPQITNSLVAKSGFKDGQYTGSAADAFYGIVQVKTIISNGKLVDIQFLQYPNHSGHSLEISNYSMPQLKQEALQAQSANVDIISGATQTSQAFMQSISSALSQAG